MIPISFRSYFGLLDFSGPACPIPMDQRAVAVQDLRRLLFLHGRECRYAKFMAQALSSFLEFYGRGRALDAAIWARRAAECYGLFVVMELQGVHADDLLGDLTWRLPDRHTWSTSFSMCGHPIVGRVAAELGAGLSTATIWDDLEALRYWGNPGGHAHAMLRDGRIELEPLFVPMLRVCLSFCGLCYDRRGLSRL